MNDVKNADPKRKAGEQLPLVFSHDAASGRDDLLISERLAAAVSIVDAWPAWMKCNRLVITSSLLPGDLSSPNTREIKVVA